MGESSAAEAARQAYQRYAPALMRKCQRMLGSQQDTEDVVQGLFLDMLRNDAIRPDLPYLYRAVTNRCLNHLRQGNNRRRLLEQHDVALRGVARTRCDDQVIGTDLLLKLTAELDDKHNEVLVYRFVDDMTQEEIAELTATSRKTIGKRLRRIRDAVRALRERNGGDHEPGGEIGVDAVGGAAGGAEGTRA